MGFLNGGDWEGVRALDMDGKRPGELVRCKVLGIQFTCFTVPILAEAGRSLL